MDRELYVRLLGVRESKDNKTIRIALVSSIVDSYETVINPDGCLSPLESVPVDFNHNRISTGSRMEDAGKTEIEVPDGDGGNKKVIARVVDVIVPKTARMWTRENKDKRAEDVPSLYESIENGRVAWGSVDFSPVKTAVERVYNSAGELIREEYKKWRLNFFSLLDTKPGQDTSYFLSIRKLNQKRAKIMLTEIINKIKAILETAQVAVENVSEVEIIPTSDTEGLINFSLNDAEDKSIAYTMDENSDMILAEEIQDRVTEEEDAEEDVEVDPAKEDVQEVAPAEGEEKKEEVVEEEKVDEEPMRKRAYVNAVLKSKSGQIALVTQVVGIKSGEGVDETVTAQVVGSEDTIEIKGSDIGWNGMAMSSEGDVETKEWLYADLGDVVSVLLVTKKPVDGSDPTAEANRKLKELTDELLKKDNDYRLLEENYKKLSSSPKIPSKLRSDSAAELASESAKQKEEEELRIAKVQSRSRY